MLKKAILVAMAVAAFAAVAAPAASANWTHEGNPLEGNPIVEFHGTTEFSGGIGSVHCEDSTAEIELTGGTNIGHVLSFTVDNPTVNCEVTGLASLACTGSPAASTTLESAGLLQEALATIEGGTIGVTEVELTNIFFNGNGPCADVTLTNVVEEGAEVPITATPNNAGSIEEVELGGSLATSVGGTVEINGTLAATPSGTYGIE
jgi:hypothetical protein